MTKQLFCLLAVVGLAIWGTTDVQASLINGDFSNAAEFGNPSVFVEWQHRDAGWYHSGGWVLDGDERAESTGTNARFGQVFANDQTGTNAEFSFEWDALDGTDVQRDLRYWVWGWELIDATDPPEDDDPFFQLTGTNVDNPDGYIMVELLQGTAVDDQPGSKTFTLTITDDVTDFEWIGVRFEGRSGLNGRWVDNVSFVPEPSIFAPVALGLVGLVTRGRQR